jgi:uncharacterized protein YukE
VASYEDVMRVDPNAYTEEARNWQRAADGIRDRGADLEQKLKKLEDWQGAAADYAKSALSGYRRQYADAAEAMAKIPLVLDDAARRIGDARRDLMQVNAEARQVGLRIEHDGRIAIPPGTTGQGFGETYHRLQDGLRRAIDAATQADSDTAAALRRLSAQSAGLASPDQSTVAAAATAIPRKGTAPADVKQWWDSLTPMQQESLLFTHASQIGALDGVPATARDRANRSRLVELKGQLDAERQRLDAKGGQLSQAEASRLADINAKLDGIKTIEDRLRPPKPPQQPAFLLGIDTAVNGRAIVAIGNPDTAANICTYVPGTGAKLAEVGREIGRADQMVESTAAVSRQPTSTIAWIGYDAPQNPILEASNESYAQGARQDLDRFQDGLRASHEGARSHNIVLGHSYGSTVIGHAAHYERLDVDDVIFLGSPGAGIGIDNASKLNLPPEHVHATVADHDMIKQTNNPNSYTGDMDAMVTDFLGPDPADPRFGGHVFASDPGAPGGPFGSTEAHSQYWDYGTASLRSMGRIIAGQPTE